MIIVTIKQNSWLAKLASYRLGVKGIALVIGRRIHLYGCKSEDFLDNVKWVRHEIAHVKQYRKYGFLRFIFLYLLESFNKGYYNNKFEIEARKLEKDVNIMKGIKIR